MAETSTYDRSTPTPADIKRLFALSGNRCAFPKCRIPVVENGILLGEVCHIRAAQPGGPRYDASQSGHERHSFANLILLCGNHHTVIDADEDSYTDERLLKMKADHEAHSSGLSEQAIHEFESAFDQSMTIIGQSGGVAAHTVQAGTINVNSAPASTLLEARTMQAIDTVWGVMLGIESAFRTVTFVDSILTQEELAAGFERGDSSDLFRSLREFATHEAVISAMQSAGSDRVESERPYLNRRLYGQYFIFQAVMGRCATLVAFSFERRAFQSWRKDEGVKAHLEAALPKEWVEQLWQRQHHGLYSVIDALKDAFLTEAERQRASVRKA